MATKKTPTKPVEDVVEDIVVTPAEIVTVDEITEQTAPVESVEPQQEEAPVEQVPYLTCTTHRDIYKIPAEQYNYKCGTILVGRKYRISKTLVNREGTWHKIDKGFVKEDEFVTIQ